MVTVTGPAVAIVLVVGYLGMNTLINGAKRLLHRRNEKTEEHETEKE